MKNRISLRRFLCILTPLTFFLFSGCERFDFRREKIGIGEPFICRIGTSYRIDRDLSFRIDSIKDYRCPQNVECFWSGDVDLHFTINQHDQHTDTLIYFLTRNTNPFIIGGYTWKILEVNPKPIAGQVTDPCYYRIKLLIREN